MSDVFLSLHFLLCLIRQYISLRPTFFKFQISFAFHSPRLSRSISIKADYFAIFLQVEFTISLPALQTHTSQTIFPPYESIPFVHIQLYFTWTFSAFWSSISLLPPLKIANIWIVLFYCCGYYCYEHYYYLKQWPILNRNFRILFLKVCVGMST